MPKILWVALPLLIAAAAFAVLVLRGRAPTRHAINVVSSVLLLAYVATTASLGIFWVANQQLPVFDWHYLFGYGTVLLVLLHLAFNFPIVWRYLARRHAPPSAAAPGGALPAARRSRRGVVLGALGVGAATGAAFVFGLRHGRSELRFEPSADDRSPVGVAVPAPATQALALIERFHALSSHSRTSVLLRAPGVDWGDPPPPFKRNPGTAGQALPPPGTARAERFDLAALADTLWHTAGVTEVRGGLHLRASPSSGALFSTELYVAARKGVPGLGPGLWHYDAQRHALQRLAEVSNEALHLGAIDAQPTLRNALALVAATAVFGRTGHKYRDRTYRYVLADLGHALENLRVAADALGARATLVAAFDEARAARALGVDQAQEGVLALIALDVPAAAAESAAPASAAAALPPGDAVASERWVASSASAAGASLGVTAAVHAATSLHAAAAKAAPPAPPAATDGRMRREVSPLPSPTRADADWLRVIALRRSVRRFADAPLPLQALASVLASMTSPHGPILSPAVHVYVVAHAVTGLAPGAYRYEPARQALLQRRATAGPRAVSRAAALDQDVVGDAAAVFVLAIDRTGFAADALGPARGYRHAFLEAGMVGERVYLQAVARGLGACAVGAFYDDEAAALVGADPAREWVVHFAALGVVD